MEEKKQAMRNICGKGVSERDNGQCGKSKEAKCLAKAGNAEAACWSRVEERGHLGEVT